MIRSIRDLLGRSPSPSRQVRSAPQMRVPAGQDFRAVEISPGLSACTAARDAAGRKFLMRKAPTLPLTGCSRPDQCKCRFTGAGDRLEGEPRLEGGVLPSGRAGEEPRESSRRRPPQR